MPFDACNPDRPCAICGNTNQYCSFSPDGGIMCRKGLFDGPDGRPAKEKYDKQGSPFWQWLPKSDNAPATYTQESACKAAPVEQLDRVYREMFSRLSLTKAHKEALLARGLVEADLVHFRSLAREDRKVAQHLANLFPFWQQVPGLYVTPTGKPMLGGAEGLIFGCRDLQGRIQAIRTRADNPVDSGNRYGVLSSKKHGGPSPGAPASDWPGESPSNQLRLTEGELKAAVAARKTGVSTVSGGAGVSSLASKQIEEWLSELGPTTVLLAPDADARTSTTVNRAVRHVVKRLEAIGKVLGFELKVETWEGDAKGIDDALVAGATIQALTPDEYLDTLPRPASDTTRPTGETEAQRDSGNNGTRRVVLTGINFDKAEQILKAMQEANSPLKAFVWAPTDKISDLRETRVTQCLTPENLSILCQRRLSLRFFAINKEGEEQATDPPDKALKLILGTPSDDTGLPIIKEFVDAPVLATDGTLILEPGLHSTGIYYRGGLDVPPIPDAPSHELATECLEQLLGLVSDFPFEAQEDRQAFLSYLLTGFVAAKAPRPWPMWHYSAPTQGSGKGLLASIPALIAQGAVPGVVSLDASEKDPEIRKKLTSLLDSNPARWQILDNVKGHLASGSLEAFLTTTVWTDRLLGGNKMGTWMINVALALTGNNLTLSPDLERRQILIRLTPDTDQPWLRTGFRHQNLKQHVLANRAQIVWQILVLVQRWASLGFPQGNKRLGSFEGWSEAMSGFLDCIGMGSDFLATTRARVKEDPWRVFCQLWTESHLSLSNQTAGQLCRFTKEAGIVLAEGSPAMSLGKRLAKQEGRVFSIEDKDGEELFKLTTNASGRNVTWNLVRISTERNSSEKSPQSKRSPAELYGKGLSGGGTLFSKSRQVSEVPPEVPPPDDDIPTADLIEGLI